MDCGCKEFPNNNVNIKTAIDIIFFTATSLIIIVKRECS